MNHWFSLLRRGGCVLNGSLSLLAAIAAGQTTLPDYTNEDLTLLAGQTYLAETDLVVDTDATLLVEPGAEIICEESVSILIYGQLEAAGDPSAPIVFRGIRAENGLWGGIRIEGGADSPGRMSQLQHVSIQDGGAYDGNLSIVNASAEIQYCDFTRSGRSGIAVDYRSHLIVEDSSFNGNGDGAVYFDVFPADSTLANLTATNNAFDGITVGWSILESSTTWQNCGLPFLLPSGLRVNEGATLTVEPGVRAFFESGGGLQIDGAIICPGEPSKPILFSARGATPGSWPGVVLGDYSESRVRSIFQHTTIEYGGEYSANLVVSNAEVLVSNCVIRESAGDGIELSWRALASISNSELTGNADYPLFLTYGDEPLQLSGIAASGNGLDAIGMGYGTSSQDQTWHNVGLPYHILSGFTMGTSGTLTIEAGCTLHFDPYADLNIEGRILSLGSKEAPVLMTRTPGAAENWAGLRIASYGDTTTGGSQLTHTIIENAGVYGESVTLSWAKAVFNHCTVRGSTNDAVEAEHAGGTVFLSCHFQNNPGYAISVYGGGFVDASNCWWGDATGPYHEMCNPDGLGDAISDGVEFRPYLTSQDQEPGPFSPSDMMELTLSPQRWFAPASSGAPVYVKATLRSGTGQPLPGHTVLVETTLGSVEDGGITGADGTVYAILTSDEPGEAVLTGSLEGTAMCSYAISEPVRVVFTPFSGASGDLLDEEKAPYLSDQIEIDPLPLIQGSPVTLSARLVNPSEVPVYVDGTFSIMQFGIGMVFGPIANVQNFEIPAGGERTMTAPWTPPISGHYCIQFDYVFSTEKGKQKMAQSRGGSATRNADFRQSNSRSPRSNNALNRARKALGFMSKIPGGSHLNIPKTVAMRGIKWQLDTAEEISKALGGDPPTLNYKSFTTRPRPQYTAAVAGPDISAAEAAAYNELMEKLCDLLYSGRAAMISLDRRDSAAAAEELDWSSLQEAAFQHHMAALATAFTATGTEMLEYVQVLRASGADDVHVTPAMIMDYQQRLGDSGFTAEEIAEARLAGLTDDEIEAARVGQMAVDPFAASGRIFEWLEELGAELKETGRIIAEDTTFPTGSDTRQGGPGLASVGETRTQFLVGNPLDHATTVSLRVRMTDAPPDMAVSVTPRMKYLKPGETITATATAVPGGAMIQGGTVSFAVEGYAEGELLGGVSVTLVIPEQRTYQGHTNPTMWLAY